ncbi:hypothetical protein GK047_21005 [Paenibacillus sp. SYP-B3998]|uniref:Uncharacterized protein n=1 Tax=Paenibacillus sp. SYP-B3998 TaxID=2678564 RepID=A0A6G4A2C6_9BACL|nr:hypothetical protein [Paenibacillus sp. SYP-B3998]NEW08480.1 hypothetical protein [Paenibacillus sp. SYP-B3998]
MWNAIRISDNLYGFQLEQGYLEPWAAVGQITTVQRELVLLVDLFLLEVESREQYEKLLDAVREFLRNKAVALGFSSFKIRFNCKGLIEEEAGLPLPTTLHTSGMLAVDYEFVEEEWVKHIGHVI